MPREIPAKELTLILESGILWCRAARGDARAIAFESLKAFDAQFARGHRARRPLLEDRFFRMLTETMAQMAARHGPGPAARQALGPLEHMRSKYLHLRPSIFLGKKERRASRRRVR